MRHVKAVVLAVVFAACVAGCAGVTRGARAGFEAGIGDGPMPVPQKSSNPLDYAGEFIAGLLAYAAGSLGKGYVRSKLGIELKPKDEA